LLDKSTLITAVETLDIASAQWWLLSYTRIFLFRRNSC